MSEPIRVRTTYITFRDATKNIAEMLKLVQCETEEIYFTYI